MNRRCMKVMVNYMVCMVYATSPSGSSAEIRHSTWGWAKLTEILIKDLSLMPAKNHLPSGRNVKTKQKGDFLLEVHCDASGLAKINVDDLAILLALCNVRASWSCCLTSCCCLFTCPHRQYLHHLSISFLSLINVAQSRAFLNPVKVPLRVYGVGPRISCWCSRGSAKAVPRDVVALDWLQLCSSKSTTTCQSRAHFHSTHSLDDSSICWALKISCRQKIDVVFLTYLLSYLLRRSERCGHCRCFCPNLHWCMLFSLK